MASVQWGSKRQLVELRTEVDDLVASRRGTAGYVSSTRGLTVRTGMPDICSNPSPERKDVRS